MVPPPKPAQAPTAGDDAASLALPAFFPATGAAHGCGQSLFAPREDLPDPFAQGDASVFGGADAASVFCGSLLPPVDEARMAPAAVDVDAGAEGDAGHSMLVFPEPRSYSELTLHTVPDDLAAIYASVLSIRVWDGRGVSAEVAPRATKGGLVVAGHNLTTGEAITSTSAFMGVDHPWWVVTVSTSNIESPIPFKPSSLDLRAVLTPKACSFASLPLAFLAAVGANIQPSAATILPADKLRFFGIFYAALHQAMNNFGVDGADPVLRLLSASPLSVTPKGLGARPPPAPKSAPMFVVRKPSSEPKAAGSTKRPPLVLAPPTVFKRRRT